MFRAGLSRKGLRAAEIGVSATWMGVSATFCAVHEARTGPFVTDKEIFATSVGVGEPRIAGSERIFVCLEPRQRFAEGRQGVFVAKKALFATTKTTGIIPLE